MKLRLHSPRQLARNLLRAARRDRDEVEEYLDSRPAEWEALVASVPGDAADVLEELSEEAAIELLGDLDPDDAAGILEEISPELAADILEELPVDTAAAALDLMDAEDAADLIGELPEDAAAVVLGAMSPEEAEAVRRLLVYPADSAGGLMSQEIAVLPLGLTVGEAIERIRILNDELDDLSYVYVVDEEDRLKGVISFRDLVFERPGSGLDEAMVPDPVSVAAFTDRERVADLVQRYHLFGIPVTDDNGRLLGMVTTDAVLEAVQEEASEDFATAVGAGAEETVYSDVLPSAWMRSPWLMINLVLSLVVALVIERQTGIITEVPILAALMPVVALLGGNAGTQSLAVVIRSLAADDVPTSRILGVLGRQLRIGLVVGLLVAVAAAVVTQLLVQWGLFSARGAPGARVALAVAAAVLANLTIATTVGAAIPLLLRRLGQDPALASSIFLTFVTDMVGFGGFLLVASALI
ncbi:MAG TPA: magnesium transporter [Acidimicrobiia bacterium]|nr:magnesium transporter [Acidimicrobiia bacterium]